MRATGLLAAAFLVVPPVSVVLGAVHRMFVGNLNGPAAIYALDFDDQTHSLSLRRNISAFSSHAWISFNHDKSYLYGVSLQAPRLASYAVSASPSDGLNLHLNSTVSFTGSCADKTSAFVLSSAMAPYRIYSAAWPGPEACGAALSLQPDSGAARSPTQSWRYLTASGIHGLALGRRSNELLYSADLNGDSVWTHSIDGPTGIVTELNRLSVANGSHPRHLVAHPLGTYLYVVMEAGNSLAAYGLDVDTGIPTSQDGSFSLLPPNITETTNTTSQYWSAEVMLSHDARYLWATSRAAMNTQNYGFINGFLLDDDGRIVKRMFQQQTTTTGGYANQIAPAPEELGSEWAAMADWPRGYVQMWRMTGSRNVPELGLVEYTGAEAVATRLVEDGGCCANVAWYD